MIIYLCTGCITKYDSWWLVLNVVFYILFYILKTCCGLFCFKNLFLKYILLWNQFYRKMTPIQYVLSFSLVSNNFRNYGRIHFKPFTNCHVSWDTLYVLDCRKIRIKWDFLLNILFFQKWCPSLGKRDLQVQINA